MDKNEQYERVCKHEFVVITDLLRDIERKLFKGNGQPPLMTQIDRLNSFKKMVCWVSSIIVIVGVGLVARLIYTAIVN